jgi:hypothetical protein
MQCDIINNLHIQVFLLSLVPSARIDRWMAHYNALPKAAPKQQRAI